MHARYIVVAVLAATVLAAVVGTASALALRAFFSERAVIGLPREGTAPTTPKNGMLVISYWVTGTDPNPRGKRAWVYADGRLIWLWDGDPHQPRLPEAANGWSSGFLEQRLTREGVERLRSEIVSAGGFGPDRQPRVSQSLTGMPHTSFAVRKGDRLVSLTWVRDVWRLKARLAHPTSWLPASAWKKRQIRAYVPSSLAVCAAVPSGQQSNPSRIVALLPAAAQDVLRAKRWVKQGSGGEYCFAVTTSQARLLAKGLGEARPDSRGGAFIQKFVFDAPRSERVRITFEPFLPHGETICAACG
jgi:hypothetical protein